MRTVARQPSVAYLSGKDINSDTVNWPVRPIAKILAMTNLIERKGIVELSSAMVIMGTVGLFVIESGQSVYNVVFYRCVIGVLFLVLFCLYSGKFKESGLTLKKIALIALSGVFLTTNWLMLFSSFKAASISTSTVIYHVQPFFFINLGSIISQASIC